MWLPPLGGSDGAGFRRGLFADRHGDAPLTLEFTKGLWEFETLPVPFRAETNLTVLKLRPAHTWMPGHGDVRSCSVFLAALRLEPVAEPGR